MFMRWLVGWLIVLAALPVLTLFGWWWVGGDDPLEWVAAGLLLAVVLGVLAFVAWVVGGLVVS